MRKSKRGNVIRRNDREVMKRYVKCFLHAENAECQRHLMEIYHAMN